MSTCKIENNTARLIVLPPTDTFPTGMKLLPGLNNVPEVFLEELRDKVVDPEPLKNGTPRAPRFPGREALDLLLIPVRIIKADSEHTGPQITIFADEQVGPPSGPPAPHDLTQYKKEEVAVAMVRATKDKAALKAYLKDPREAVQVAAKARLAE